MKVRVGDGATGDEAEAIANALVRHLGTDVNIFVGDGEEAVADAEPPADTFPLDDDMGPTEREEQLREEITDIPGGGPEKYKQRLPESGKLFVRDRLELWFPDGLALEGGKFANFGSWHENSPEVDGADPNTCLPGDGLLTGAAEFEGHDLHVMANDFTVKAGLIARRDVEKFLRMQQRALKIGKPVLYLMDSSGGRIDQQTGFFANREGIGKYYYNHSMLSGYVPRICVLYGLCIVDAAYTSVFTDSTVMAEGMSAMTITSPRMVKMVTGEEISMQDLGGARIHTKEPGSTDLIARNEAHARELVSQLVTYPPGKAGERSPHAESKPPQYSPDDIDELIPESPNRPYDVHDPVERVVDAESVFELKPDCGKEIVTASARIDSRPVGIVANQPTERSRATFPDAAEKAAEFIWACDAYEIPLLYLCDTPGFMAGSQVEKDAILEKGKKFAYTTSSTTVPKQTVIVWKAYGAGIHTMGGPTYDPKSVIALPSGEIGIVGPEAAINAVYANKFADVDDPEERARIGDELREEYREDIDTHRMASEVVIDEIIPPSTLRDGLAVCLEFYADVEKPLPDRKHGTVI